VFVIAYVLALIVVGLPMLILELTLGQKMQRGSAGAIRGILPRFSGAGWAATFAGFITCVIYVLMLGLVGTYLIESGNKPWKVSNYEEYRPIACK
jgi:SNF family Na+-dependent transporter